MISQSVSINRGEFLYIDGMEANVLNGTLGLWGVSSGRCRDSQNNIDIELNTNPNSQNYLSVSPVTNKFLGVGGVDSFLSVQLTSTVYAIYVIADSSGKNLPNTLCSIATNGYIPILPAGYDSYRLVGYTKSNSSKNFDANTVNVGFRNNRQMVYLNTQSVQATPSGTLKKVLLTNEFAPSIDGLLVTFGIYYTGSDSGSILQIGSANNSSTLIGYIATQVATQIIYCQYDMVCPFDITLLPAFYFDTGASDTLNIVLEKFYYTV